MQNKLRYDAVSSECTAQLKLDCTSGGLCCQERTLMVCMLMLNYYHCYVSCMMCFVCGSSSDVTLLAGIIVLEEFCKELAAIAFIKHYAEST